MLSDEALKNAADGINKSPAAVKNAPKGAKKDLLTMWVDFVNAHNLAIKRDGKVYLRVEAWNYLFAQKGLSPTVIEVTTHNCEMDDGKTETAFVAKAGLIPMTTKVTDEGVPIGAISFAACRIGENDYCADYYSALSMAQTRAIGKLGRTVFGHLAIACGFQATPLEELPAGN